MTPAVLSELRSSASRRLLKSDVKKSTALVKRVTSLTEETVPMIIREIETMNLARYASEIAVSIVADKLKPSDVENVVPVCAALHARYTGACA